MSVVAEYSETSESSYYEIEYDSDGDEVIEIEEYIYETDSETGSCYEEEVINELDAVPEGEEDSESEGGDADDEGSVDDDDDDEFQPEWAKIKLRKTGIGQQLQRTGNLAAPITFTPFKKTKHTNTVANQGLLRKTEMGEKIMNGERLELPITKIRDVIKKSMTSPNGKINKRMRMVTRRVKLKNLNEEERAKLPALLPLQQAGGSPAVPIQAPALVSS